MTLSPSERDAVSRATQLLERTHYDETDAGDQRLTDARMVARGTLELADALQAERSARAALKQRCDDQQAILGKAAYLALSADEEPG